MKLPNSQAVVLIAEVLQLIPNDIEYIIDIFGGLYTNEDVNEDVKEATRVKILQLQYVDFDALTRKDIKQIISKAKFGDDSCLYENEIFGAVNDLCSGIEDVLG